MAQIQEAETQRGPKGLRSARQAGASRDEAAAEYRVREYISGMAKELAQMARWDGDEGLAVLLEAAVLRAEGDRP